MEQSVVILGWALAIAATAIALPQLVQVLRTGRDEGVSLRTCTLAAASTFAWFGYTVGLADIPAVASSVGPMLAWLLCGIVVAHRRRVLLRYGAEITLLITAVALAGTLLGAFRVLAVGGSLLWVLPQVLSTFRQKDLSGVSVPAYVLLAVENAGWVLYAWGTRTPAYALAPLVQGPLALLIAIYTLRTHRAATLLPTDYKLTPQTNALRRDPANEDQAADARVPSYTTVTTYASYDELVGEVALNCHRS